MRLIKNILFIIDSIVQILIFISHFVFLWRAVLYDDIMLLAFLIPAGFYQFLLSNSLHSYFDTFETKPNIWRVRYFQWSLITIVVTFTPIAFITLFSVVHFLLYLSVFLSFQATYKHFKYAPVDLLEIQTGRQGRF